MVIFSLIFLFLISFAFAFPKEIASNFDWVDFPNNKFGIHLAVPAKEDLENAAELVNSSGGDWGYATLIIEEGDRHQQKWQAVFDQMRRFHLIPIIRLATTMKNGHWRRPRPDQAAEWADFLDSLHWVVKNRYVVLFNEPNHGAEWDGVVDPQNYGEVALAFARALKEKNPDFFVMLAGFDAAAPSSRPQYEDEEKFLREMFGLSPRGPAELFDYLDGWVSHSYPNYGFIGSPKDRGRNSIKNYQWELTLLSNLGVDRKLPVFIAETGWPHSEGVALKKAFYSAAKVADYFQIYFEDIVKDSSVIAITPFILNYQSAPFDHFSWQKLNSDEFYPQYQAVKKISKPKGRPFQEQKLNLLSSLPAKLIKNSTYQVQFKIRNEGQAIWTPVDNYQLVLEKTPPGFEFFFSGFTSISPLEEETVSLSLKTDDNLGKLNLSLAISQDGQVTSNLIPWNLEILPEVTVNLDVRLFLKRKAEGEDFKLLIYDTNEKVVFEADRIKVEEGKSEISEVKNLLINEPYRLVILKPFYLPRQSFLTIGEGKNKAVFKPMLPVDFNLDGKLSLADITEIPRKLEWLRLWWPY